jgi:hypothetical protein
MEAEATLGTRLNEGQSTIHPNGCEHVDATRLHHAVHQLMPTKDLLERGPQGC